MSSISIDSNVLNILEKESKAFEKFLNSLKNGSFQFVCTMDMAMENLLGQNFDAVWSRYQILCALDKELRNSFHILPLAQDSIPKEVKRSRLTRAFPTEKREKIIQSWASKPQMTNQFNRSRDLVIETRDKLKHTSNTVKLLRETQDPSALMRTEIKKYSGFACSRLTTFISQKSLEAFKLPISKTRIKNIACSNKKYATTRAYLNIILIKDMLAHISDNYFPDGLEKAQSVRDSDTIDLLIATASTFADFFITEDKGLKQLLDFLYVRKIINTKTISLEDFFQSYEC